MQAKVTTLLLLWRYSGSKKNHMKDLDEVYQVYKAYQNEVDAFFLNVGMGG